MYFRFCWILTIINRLKRLSLLLTREKIVSLFIVWKWGHVDVLITLFQFHCSLMIINRLKWLSLLLTRKKIVSLFVLWKWGHDDVLVMSFQFRWSLMIINRLNWLSLLLTREKNCKFISGVVRVVWFKSIDLNHWFKSWFKSL